MSGGISISWQHESLCPMYGLGVVVNSATLANARSLWFNVGALNHLHTTWSLGQGVVFSRAVFLYCDLLRLSFDWVFCCPFSKGFLCELSQLTNPKLGFSAPVWARAARPAGLINSMFLQKLEGSIPDLLRLSLGWVRFLPPHFLPNLVPSTITFDDIVFSFSRNNRYDSESNLFLLLELPPIILMTP